MKFLHSYARFSHSSQAKGTSKERQRDLPAEFLKKHPGYQLSEMMLDAGKSAFKGNKQVALAGFLKRIESGDVKPGDCLLVEAIDRLSRKGVRDTQTVVNKILDAGVDIAIFFPHEKIYRANDANDLAGVVELASFAFAANAYSANLSIRSSKWYEKARAKAHDNGTIINSGSPPAWLTRTKDKFTVIPERAEAIKFIFQKTIDGFGMNLLQKMLHEKFPPMGKKKIWNGTYIRAILTDRRVLGECQTYKMVNDKRTPTGEPLTNYYPQVIDENTFLLAQQSTSSRRAEKGPTKQFINLFTGVIFHAIDKCAVHIYQYRQTRADGTVVIYRRLQSVAHRNHVKGASVPTVDLGDFEQHILRNLRELDLSVFNGTRSTEKELTEANQILKGRLEHLAKLQAKADQSDENLDLLLPNLKKAKAAIQEAKVWLDKVKLKMKDSASDGLLAIKTLADLDNTPENRQLLREAIKKCVKRIAIMPIKLGKQKKSPVGCVIEIELVNGTRRQIHMLGSDSIIFTDHCPTTISLYDEKVTALRKRAAAVKKWMLSRVH